MDTRYVQPSPEALKAFFNTLKEHKDIKAKFFVINFLESLKNTKSPDSDQLFVAGLIYLLESKEPAIEHHLIIEGLKVNAGNPLDEKQKIIYLAMLANHIQKVDLKFRESTSQDAPSFKNEIISTALGLLDRVTFKKVPTKIFEDFDEIPDKYKKIQKSWLRLFTSSFSDYTAERKKQIKFIETLSNLIKLLSKTQEPFNYDAIVIAATFYVMFELESECSTRRPGSELYRLLQRVSRINHSSEIAPEIQKLYFDELFKFLRTISIQQWIDARPLTALDFNIKHYVHDKMYDEIPKIKLQAHTPNSIPYCALKTVGTGVSYLIDYGKEFAYFRFANDLYTVGIGRNSFIIAAAAKLGQYMGSYGGSVGAYIAKQYAIVLGEIVEQKAVTFSLTGMFRVTIDYLSKKNAGDEPDPIAYDPNSDPFESLINLTLIHAKKENVRIDCEFFEAVLTLYKILPDNVKIHLNQKVQEKTPAPELKTDKPVVEERKVSSYSM